jgi:thermitase
MESARRVLVGVLDTGVDLLHPALGGRLVPGATFVSGTASEQDDNGHGTGTAGVIAALTSRAFAVAGVRSNSELLPVKVADAAGHTDDRQVARGIVWAVNRGAQVLNLSLGTEDIAQMRYAIEYAYSRNVVVVAASRGGETHYPAPAMYRQVIAVGRSDQAVSTSDSRTHNVVNLVLARSAGVWTTALGGGYREFLPSASIAAPHVSAVAALLLSVRPHLRVDQVIDAVRRGADVQYGVGRLNAQRSLEIVLGLPEDGS